MKTLLGILACLYGAGFFLFDKNYEAGILCIILAVLAGIWHSIDKRKED